MARPISTLLTIVATLAWASPAAAQQTNAPPGNSGVGEYLEVVPGAGGDSPAGDGKNGGDEGKIRGRGAPLPSGPDRALRSRGVAGAAAAELANRSSPDGAGGKSGSGSRSGSRSGAPGAGSGAGSSSGESGGGSVRRSLGAAASGDISGGDGMGWTLPALLLATLAGGVAIGVRRWRMSAS